MDAAMSRLDNPYLAAALVVIAAVSCYHSKRAYDRITFKEAKKNIVLTKEEQKAMVKAFADGSAYASGATTPPLPSPLDPISDKIPKPGSGKK